MSVFDPIQLIPGAWGDTPYGFFSTWFSCNGIGSHHWFCDRQIDRAIARAQALKASSPKAAAAAFAGIDRKLVDLAAWAPIVDEQGIDLVSARVRQLPIPPLLGHHGRPTLGPLTQATRRTEPPKQPSRVDSSRS
jgi:ABC-type transport system substrate-binding protein